MRPAIGSARLLASLLLALISVQNAMAAPGDLLSTDKTNVNVRVSPSTDAGIVTRLSPGETAIEIGTLDDWYRIRLPNQDREGWVYAPLMTPLVSLETRPANEEPATPVAAKPEVAPRVPVERAPLVARAPEPSVERRPSRSSDERLLARLDQFNENLTGDPRRGESVFVKCGSCHTTVPDIHADGPSLVGVFNNAPARSPGYRYSGAMEAFAREGAVWDAATLDRFIQRPARIVKGTSMPFSGLRDPQDRRDLIAFLEQISR